MTAVSALSLEPRRPATTPSPRRSEARAESAQARAAEAANGQLTEQEVAEVARLAQIDRQVRQHEMAHMAAGAGLITSGARYTYRRGPDGRSFAVGGEVGISVAKGQTPQATLARARQIEAAALAPADPSAQDHAVAASAAHMALQAQVELARQQTEDKKDAEADPDGGRETPSGDASAASRAYRDIDLFWRRAPPSFSARA